MIATDNDAECRPQIYPMNALNKSVSVWHINIGGT